MHAAHACRVGKYMLHRILYTQAQMQKMRACVWRAFLRSGGQTFLSHI